ncbi:hypothetical protein GXW78_22840 [Roseomonas terrae]|uniref:Uncharacterized protein n=1 Tax=Neoroseomonas terrae TaxID=424799 RepID=A0ABS5ENA8_9PROT|nr:hypothetical protein [Neoroseomonas terrae]MBR0652511.1 hypothetical protein [Neoroseomonas terrae]
MRLPPQSEFLYIPIEDPPVTAPVDVLVLGPAPADPLPAEVLVLGTALADPLPAEVLVLGQALTDLLSANVQIPNPSAGDASIPVLGGAEPPPGAGPGLPTEDAFPTLAELDAILAAHAGPQAGPDATQRAEVAALLGLDPAIAADPDLYAAVIGAMPDPNEDDVLLIWLAEAGAEPCPPEFPERACDWQVG